ncbi:choline/ethanolamine kinase-like [Zerene cesonia]|uniref:choline/ethanolamine kinase-like n=1 Tax=Zerene cesonia TaxID=33412 RepID=UPI0018E554FC|nr:choline/ethanolamine kinase-like [Zerene cesonia]
MNRSSYWKLQMCGTEEEMREVAGRICRNYLHGAWKSTDPRDLDFKRISGGLSNFLYYVALPSEPAKLGGFRRESSPDADQDLKLKKQMLSAHSFSLDEPKKVLLRIYGQVHGERAMDAIVTESVIFTLLSERRLGPKLHGVFSGGRIEEYIPARALLTKELSEPALSMKIAEKMAAIHSMDVPLSKEPNWLWKTMAKWLRTVKEERLAALPANMRAEERRVAERLRAVEWEAEIEWLKRLTAALYSPVVFCHNDMQEGNILILEDEVETGGEGSGMEGSGAEAAAVAGVVGAGSEGEGVEGVEGGEYAYKEADSASLSSAELGEPRLVLIDFEYCAYNYRAFDIANHLQEWCYDYTNPEHPFYYENYENAPTLEQKEIFIKEYLKHAGEPDAAESIDEINRLLDEIDAFALASHLFWSLWSIVNASKSQIPFGYWEYGLSRLETYLRLKQELIKKEKYGFPQKRKICEVDI